MAIKKSDLIAAFCDKIQTDLDQMKAAAFAAHEAAIDPESKAEDQYDTRGLEASYLAEAQAKRVGELQEVLLLFKNMQLKEFSNQDAVALTTLVEVESSGKKSLLFILPKGGGQFILFASKSVQIITPSSPLGEALLGRKAGDVFEVENAQGSREYEILSLI